ncbi:MAG: ribose 5-phosphate isomerase B [Thermodesulfobacteriota bacterium]
MEKVIIASDHGGFELKEELKGFISGLGYEVVDKGCDSEASVDYPDIATPVASAVSKGDFKRAILICGTGIGMCMVANKFPGVRAALTGDIFSARMSREHNDSNILVLGGRVIGKELAREIVRVWLSTAYTVETRHERRLGKIKDIEKKGC